MRALLFILLGLAIGSIATAMTLNALRAATAFPKGVMALLGHHMNGAREAATAPTCPGEVAHHLEAIRVISRDIKPAYLPIGDGDELFGRYADQLQQAAIEPLAEGASCDQALQRVAAVGDACKACHRDFK